MTIKKNLCIYIIILITRQSLGGYKYIQYTIKTNIIPATSVLD